MNTSQVDQNFDKKGNFSTVLELTGLSVLECEALPPVCHEHAPFFHSEMGVCFRKS